VPITERQQHQQVAQRRREEDRGEQHRRDHGDRVGFEQIGCHAGAVADIVADIVGDDRRVARIVLRDPRLDLADEVGPDIGALGKDAAAEPGEDRDQRGAEAQPHHRFEDRAQIIAGHHRAQDEIIAADAEDPQPDHQHPGDRAGLEGDVETGAQAAARGLRGPYIGAHRYVHADIAGGARQHRADQIADRDARPEGDPENDQDHHPDDRDRAVLAVEIGAGADLDRARDFLHPRVPGIRRQHDPAGVEPVGQRQHAAGNDENICRRHLQFPQRRSEMKNPPATAARRGRPGRAPYARSPRMRQPAGRTVTIRRIAPPSRRCAAAAKTR
jgi:hypothetical protein